MSEDFISTVDDRTDFEHSCCNIPACQSLSTLRAVSPGSPGRAGQSSVPGITPLAAGEKIAFAQKKKSAKKSKFARVGDAVLNDMVDWCQGRSALVRLPLLLLFGYVLIQHMQDPLYSDFFKPLNLTIHELGHYVFAPFGEFMHIAGGSLFQCLIPLVVGIPMFFRQRDYFAIAIAFGWFSTSLFDVATYAADARSQELPLVSPGMAGNSQEIIHDWHWLLETTNLLPYDHSIAQFLRFLAFCSTLICLLMGGALCFVMFKSKKKEAIDSESRSARLD